MFAGPNGSGKSTLKSCLPKELLGVYLNPDEIEEEIRGQGSLDFTTFGVTTTFDEVSSFLRTKRLRLRSRQ
jgi:predicted ABC-type ATPase